MYPENSGALPVEFLPGKIDAITEAEHRGARRLGLEVTEIQRTGKSLALIGRMRIEQTMLLRCVAKPGSVINAVRGDGKGWPVMRTGGDIPVFVAEPHRRHLAVQLDQRVVADVGVVDVAPCDDRVIIGIHGHGRAAAFADMVGDFDVAPEAYPAVIRHRIIDGRTVIFFPFFFRSTLLAFVEPGDIYMPLAVHRHGVEAMTDDFAVI